MPRVVHFEIHASDPERAIAFYTSLFDWQFHKWDGPVDYWLIQTGSADTPGIDGGMIRRQGVVDGTAVIGYVCTIDVPLVDTAAQRIAELGGTIVVPKMPIPGIGWLAYGKDPDGNIFGIMHRDPNAK
jgi:uncharacterized protein